MAFGKRRYNSYRQRSYTQSDTKRREYARQMEELQQTFDKLDKYRFINVTNGNINCYIKGFKTKKEVY